MINNSCVLRCADCSEFRSLNLTAYPTPDGGKVMLCVECAGDRKRKHLAKLAIAMNEPEKQGESMAYKNEVAPDAARPDVAEQELRRAHEMLTRLGVGAGGSNLSLRIRELLMQHTEQRKPLLSRETVNWALRVTGTYEASSKKFPPERLPNE